MDQGFPARFQHPASRDREKEKFSVRNLPTLVSGGKHLSTRPPVFVLGSQRSGTTALQSILNHHPDLFLGMEINVNGLLESNRDSLRETLADHFPAADDATWNQSAASQVSALMESLVRQKGKKRWGDKWPSYSRQMARIESFFPDCQFVHIIRDGRDVACSMLAMKSRSEVWRNAEWAPATWAAASQYWHDNVRPALEHGRRLPAERYFEFRYEDMVKEPVPTMHKLCAFLGETPDPLVLRSAQGLKRSSIGSHQRKMDRTALDQWHTCHAASKLLTELGYVVSQQEYGALTI